MRKLILFILLTYPWFSNLEVGAEEQSVANNNSFWGTLGLPLGGGSARDQGYLSPVCASISYSWKSLLLTARVSAVGRIYGPSEGFEDCGLLLGYFTKKLLEEPRDDAGLTGFYVGFSLSAGVGRAIIHPIRGSSSETAGLTLESQLLLFASPIVGVGFVGFANINPNRYFWGVGLAVSLGVWGF